MPLLEVYSSEPDQQGAGLEIIPISSLVKNAGSCMCDPADRVNFDCEFIEALIGFTNQHELNESVARVSNRAFAVE